MQGLAHAHQYDIRDPIECACRRIADHLPWPRMLAQHAREVQNLADNLPGAQMTLESHPARRAKRTAKGTAGLRGYTDRRAWPAPRLKRIVGRVFAAVWRCGRIQHEHGFDSRPIVQLQEQFDCPPITRRLLACHLGPPEGPCGSEVLTERMRQCGD